MSIITRRCHVIYTGHLGKLVKENIFLQYGHILRAVNVEELIGKIPICTSMSIGQVFKII